MMLAKHIDTLATDYGKMPHEILEYGMAEVAFAVAVQQKARGNHE